MLSQEDQVRLVRDVSALVESMKYVAEDVREIKTSMGKDVATLREDVELLKKDRDRVKFAIGAAGTVGGALFGAVAWLVGLFR